LQWLTALNLFWQPLDRAGVHANNRRGGGTNWHITSGDMCQDGFARQGDRNFGKQEPVPHLRRR